MNEALPMEIPGAVFAGGRVARGIGGHHSATSISDDWLTPPWLIDKLGPFDLDPCASEGQPWPTADLHFTENEDGLVQPWTGFVWCNPPYSSGWVWLDRLADHGNGIGLVFARTETAGFFRTVWRRARVALFLEGRLHFHHPRSGIRAQANAGGPSVLVGYGRRGADTLAEHAELGQLVVL